MTFPDTAESIFTGLLRDAQTDVAYDFVSPLYSYFAVTEDKAGLKDVFVGLLKTDATLLEAIRTKNPVLLQTAILDIASSEYGSDVREVCTSLGNPDLFARDAEKKLWKRIKKLVIAAGAHELVYGDAPPSPKLQKKSKVVRRREARFKEVYQPFADRVNEVFRGKKSPVTDTTLAEFKEHALPAIVPLAEQLQSSQSTEGLGDALLQFFAEDASWVKGLPLVDADAITEEKWSAFTGSDNPRTEITESLVKVLLTVSGIEALLQSPIVMALKDKTKDIMAKRALTAESLVPTSPTFNKEAIGDLVKELVAALPEVTDGNVTLEDLKKLMENAIAGSDDVPEGLAEIFDPDIIDFDCFSVLTELPGIGDVLGPMLASMEGSIKGTVGASMFGDAVEKPAWMTREE